MAPGIVDPTPNGHGKENLNGAGEPVNTEQANHEEHQYLNLIKDILDQGEHRPDRFVKSCP